MIPGIWYAADLDSELSSLSVNENRLKGFSLFLMKLTFSFRFSFLMLKEQSG